MNIGVHRDHCCIVHGCSYGDPDCPVALGKIDQTSLCQDCPCDQDGSFYGQDNPGDCLKRIFNDMVSEGAVYRFENMNHEVKLFGLHAETDQDDDTIFVFTEFWYDEASKAYYPFRDSEGRVEEIGGIRALSVFTKKGCTLTPVASNLARRC